jgi:hypothetical protein
MHVGILESWGSSVCKLEDLWDVVGQSSSKTRDGVEYFWRGWWGELELVACCCNLSVQARVLPRPLTGVSTSAVLSGG